MNDEASKIASLARARKAKLLAAARTAANANAVSFGRTKAQKVLEAARDAKARRSLDQHRLDED